MDDLAARGFSAGADAYEAARPGYPAEAVELLATELGLGPQARVCDLAAGTGKLTRSLVASGARVVAVEPVAAMRAHLGRLAEELPEDGGGTLAEVLDGTAEQIPLDDASLDVVTVAQAFHWFDVDAALEEVARVLRPGGGLALLWNERDERTPWVAEMSRLIHWHERTVSRYQHVDWSAVVASSGRFTPLRSAVVDWTQPLTAEQLADRVRSISYVAAMPAPQRERLATEVVGLVTRMEEPFLFPYRCRLFWCRLAG